MLEIALCVLSVAVCLYFAIVRGFPWAVSKYVSHRFKCDVSIGKIDFIRRELTNVSFAKTEKNVRLFVRKVRLTTNIFNDSCSSILNLHFKELEVHLCRPRPRADDLLDNDNHEGGQWAQKIINYFSYIRFLVTFSFDDIHVYYNDPQVRSHHTQEDLAHLHVTHATVFPESTRTGFLHIVADVDKANGHGFEDSTLTVTDLKLVGVFCVLSQEPELQHADISASTIQSCLSFGFIGIVRSLLPRKKSSGRRGLAETTSSAEGESFSSSPLNFPGISFALSECDVSIGNGEHNEWRLRVTEINFSHARTDNCVIIKVNELSVDEGNNSVSIHQVNVNKRQDSLLGTWCSISVQSCVQHLHSFYRLVDLIQGGYVANEVPKISLSDSTLCIDVTSGTIEQTSSNAALHAQQITSKLGCLKNRAGDVIHIDNFHVDKDKKDNNCVFVTVANVGMAICEDSLEILFEWGSALVAYAVAEKQLSSSSSSGGSKTHYNVYQKQELQKQPPTRWSLRSQSLQLEYGLKNNLCFNLCVESSKSKSEGSLKGMACKGVSLSLKEPTSDGMTSPMPENEPFLQFPDISCTHDSELREALIKFPNKVFMQWTTLTHRALTEVVLSFKKMWMDSSLRTLVNHSKRLAVKKAGGLSKKRLKQTRRLLFSKGIEVQATLQRHTLLFSLTSFDVRINGDEWKVLMPDLVMDVDGLCRKMVKLESGVAQKMHSNPLAEKFRSEIEGLVDKDNTTIVISLALLEFNFPHQLDVHNILSNDLLGIIKWLRILHGKRGTNFDVVHPDVLFFVKQINIEFQDDPFEVALRDNFELLEDEHFEALKREDYLHKKIDELKKTHPMLQSAKIEELFNNLKKKNADIYLQRAKALRKNAAKRTRLLSFNLSSMELLIFSDRSMTGYNTTVDFIQAVDAESPWNDDMEFVSAFHKWVRFECKSATILLRDYPQALVDCKLILFWGKCALAEETPVDRAIRVQMIDQGSPYYDDFAVHRSLLSYKFYHDMALDMDFASFAHGPCWEPTLSHFSIAVSYVTGRPMDRDPSPPLSWWDKLRLLLHGRLLCSVKTLKLQMHTTLDPYNTTEEAELTFADANFDWTNGQFKILAEELNLFVRTESKYDDCRILRIPNVVLTVKLDWICFGNPMDHHNVMPCAKEKVPEYSHNIQHDSYRAFRSQNVNVNLSIVTRRSKYINDRPRLEMFSSTIRWMESLKWLFYGASRPIRRGSVFNNHQPQKQSFFRHFKTFQVSLGLHQIQLDYWNSSSMTKGVLVNVAKGLSLSSEYSLKLVRNNDGLIHRPRSNWTTEYINCQVGDSDIWFQSSCADEHQSDKRQIEKSFFFSLETVQYNRDVSLHSSSMKVAGSTNDRSPTHFLTVTGAKGAWTESNRDMAFSLYDSWRRAHILREQVAAESLKGATFQSKKAATPTGAADDVSSASSKGPSPPPSASSHSIKESNTGELSLSNFVSATASIITGGGGGDRAKDGSVPVVYSEDKSSDTKKNDMEAMAACKKDDVLFRNWVIQFLNSQMLLKGIETRGHLILSAAKTEITSQTHMPVWKDQTLTSKTSWKGCLESMQYFATVIPEDTLTVREVKEETILWLTKDKIEDYPDVDKEKRISDDLPELVGSGSSVGGVISQVVGPSQDGELGPQLQRIVSRCKCEFYYVAYGEGSLSSQEVTMNCPKRPVELWSDQEQQFVNAFSLIHHDLNVCTNSLQYNMILDVLNNLLLYIEPSFRSRAENYMRMKYQLMLSNLDDQRKPIVQLHSQIRQMVCQLRGKEKAIFALQNESTPSPTELEKLEDAVVSLKEDINSRSEELDIRERCLEEFQILSTEKQYPHITDTREELRRKSEIFFSRAHWRLTETDGQLGIADAIITNFYYTKNVMHDDSVEHLFEVGYLNVKNCLPGQLYTEVIKPTELHKDVPLDRHRTLRVYCREKSPVGGISVKEHFEINLVPLTIGITQAFYKRIMAFCFPEAVSSDHHDEAVQTGKEKKKKSSKESKSVKKAANFYVESPLKQDDVEEMKVRAQQNKLFVYIKIPEVPICVSYKGEKEKNKILDVDNFRLQVPTIEHHNTTWTWWDFLLEVKNHTRQSLLSQAIKQKLSLRHRVDAAVAGGTSTSDLHSTGNNDDEEKAKLLLGTPKSTVRKNH